MEQKKLQYNEAVMAVKSEMERVLKNTPSVITEITSALTHSVGKGVRSALTVLASCDENNESTMSTVKVAAAIELLHLATLVHDDVIDDAETRRGLPSLYRQFGKKNAIISGDYLFCLCFNLISEAYSGYSGDEYIERIDDFSRAMSLVCLGEIRQHQHNFDFDLTTRTYLKIINGKTTALFMLALYAGARAGGFSDKDSRIYGNIGRCLGSIFQLIDDCIDYEMNLSVANKPVAQDLKAGVITLPLIYAMDQDKDLHNLVLGVQSNENVNNPNFYQDIATRVKALGGIQYTKLMAKRYYNKALILIDKLESEFKKQELRDLLEKVYNREM